jgi:DNA-binding MarR family transcriptional regulator
MGSRTPKGEAVAELMLEVAQCFFRIRAVGQKAGLMTRWGGGAFGFMRSLALLGPLTVPQIAEMRPTSRQRMQRLADELAAEGLVEFIDNPKHRRSKLVQLTPKGLSTARKRPCQPEPGKGRSNQQALGSRSRRRNYISERDPLGAVLALVLHHARPHGVYRARKGEHQAIGFSGGDRPFGVRISR